MGLGGEVVVADPLARHTTHHALHLVDGIGFPTVVPTGGVAVGRCRPGGQEPPASGSDPLSRPSGPESRYRCVLLRGRSGTVISIKPERRAGCR